MFDWSGYGNGDYYPKEEKQYLWKQYLDGTGDTPEFILFENDDAGFTKVAAGARYDVKIGRRSRLKSDVATSPSP